MTIVKNTAEVLPNEGQLVHCDNGDHCDRAIFIDGKFIGGGEYPVAEYEIANVTKWFCEEEYDQHFSDAGIGCYDVSFELAEKIGGQ